MDNSEYKFENTGSFDFMVIKESKIEHLDFNDPGYVTKLVNSDFIEIVKSSPETFIEDIGHNLKVNEFEDSDMNVIKHVLCDDPDHIYEIMFLGVERELNGNQDYVNELGNLINTYEERVYGHMIILKTFVDINSDKMILADMKKSDLYEIIESRANNKVVVYEDGEWRQDIVRGDIDVFCKNLFGCDYVSYFEFPFLLHNINIAYVKSDFGQVLFPSILNAKIEGAVFFTNINDNYRGNLTLDEMNKIKELINNMDDFKPKMEWIREEKDEYGRKKIKNKYKILNFAWNEYKDNNNLGNNNE